MNAAQKHIDEIEQLFDVTAVSEYIGQREPMLWRCNSCGATMVKTIENILWHGEQNAGGLVCDCKLTEPVGRISSGEFAIIKYLRTHGVRYRREVRFDGLKMDRPLAFDFIILDDDDNPIQAIEFNGQQHYEAVKLFGDDDYLSRRIKSDRLKTEWCKEHGLPLLIIKYDDDIEKCLDKFLRA